MKTIVTSLFIIIVLSFPSKADLGLPAIQAICKVYLKDGSTVEGIITFGPGGYERYYRPHGFLLVHENGTRQFFLYNLDFYFGTVQLSSAQYSKTKVFYVEDIGEYPDAQPAYEYDEKERILKRQTVKNQTYKLLDEMVLYRKLPIEMHVGYSEHNEDDKFGINVSEIAGVELLEKPGQQWLDIIAEAREKMRIAASRQEWEDYLEPVWYHEIFDDEAKVSSLKCFFYVMY